MISLLRKIHYAYFVFCIVFVFVLFAPFYFTLSRNPRNYLLLNRLRAINSFLCTALAGVFFRFEKERPLSSHQTYIYCANHSSNLDILLFCLLAKGRFHFMGKEELMRNPLLGVFFKTIDIAVARSSKISSFRAFKRAAGNLQQGMSLIIFPEGKIGEEYPPVLHEFKNGPFRLAIEQGIPIVPVSIRNVWELMWDDGSREGSRPGVGQVYVHAPISTEHWLPEQSDELKELVFSKISSKLALSTSPLAQVG